MKVEELQHWLCAFVLEKREKDGNEFVPNSLHHICAGILRFLRAIGRQNVDFLRNKGFYDFGLFWIL